MTQQTVEQLEASLTVAALAEQLAQSPPQWTPAEIAIEIAGRAAAQGGASIFSDPHPRGSIESGLWRGGWMGAAQA